MQQKKMDDYRPNYPKKLIRGAALTAAAILTVGGATACRAVFPTQTSGIVPYEDPTEEPEVVGYEYLDETVPETEPEGDAGRDGMPLLGKIMVPEEQMP